MPLREDFSIRPMEESDLEKILEWRNLEHIRANMYTDHIITAEEHEAWFKKIKNSDDVIYLIFEYRNRPVGVINITSIDKRNKKCYWGFYLGERDLPGGIGAIMEFMALEYIFEKLAMRKLSCEVFVFNQPVVKLHTKFGFVEEGRFIQHVLKNENYEDVVSLALFKVDWLNLKNKLEKICFRSR